MYSYNTHKLTVITLTNVQPQHTSMDIYEGQQMLIVYKIQPIL